MRKYLPYAAVAALPVVLALAGLGVLAVIGGNSVSGPDKTAAVWATGIASKHYEAACAVEEPAYRGPACARSYQQNIELTNQIAGKNVVKGLRLVGHCQNVTDVKAVCVLFGPNMPDGGTVVMTQKRNKAGDWQVVGVG